MIHSERRKAEPRTRFNNNTRNLVLMKSWHSLEGKAIWVTGGAGHLGSAITAQLDAHCAKVICFDLADRAESFVRKRGLERTIGRTLDVAAVDALPSAIDAVIAEHGLPEWAGTPKLPAPRSSFLQTAPLSSPVTVLWSTAAGPLGDPDQSSTV